MIYCANNNKLYEKASDVCKDLELDRAAVSKALSGKRKSAGIYLLATVEDTSPEALKATRHWMLYSAYKIVE